MSNQPTILVNNTGRPLAIGVDEGTVVRNNVSDERIAAWKAEGRELVFAGPEDVVAESAAAAEAPVEVESTGAIEVDVRQPPKPVVQPEVGSDAPAEGSGEVVETDGGEDDGVTGEGDGEEVESEDEDQPEDETEKESE